MGFNVNGFLPRNNSLHEFVGEKVRVTPVNYNRKVDCEVKSVLTKTAIVKVIDYEAIDKFINSEKNGLAIAYLADIEKCLEETSIGR